MQSVSQRKPTKYSHSRKDLTKLKLSTEPSNTNTISSICSPRANPKRKFSTQRTQLSSIVTESSPSSHIFTSFKESANSIRTNPPKRKTTLNITNNNRFNHFNVSNKLATSLPMHPATLNKDQRSLLHRHSVNGQKITIKCKDKENKLQPYTSKPISFVISQGGLDYSGKSKQNQDNYVLIRSLFGIELLDFLGVFDGHGANGHHVSAYLRKTLSDYFSNDKTYKHETQKYSQITNDDKIQIIYNTLSNSNYKAFKHIFTSCEKNISNETYDINFSGSTCVFVARIYDRILISNIGDSRAIIVYKNNSSYKVEALTKDHKPNLPEEKKRIEMKGGVVKPHEDDKNYSDAIMRVWVKGEEYPGIAISRTIGDKVAKTVGVVCTPDVFEREVTGKEAFLIVASDGIWEFLKNEVVMDQVIPFYEKKDARGAVDKLVKEATRCWEEDGIARDDITCIVYFFEGR